jgi:glycosyltransferase involved in cell wall biosynthesis
MDHTRLSPPKVAVVIPTYNRGPLLLRAVTSVLTQTMSEFEIIVVDDGSTDDTATELEALGDARIRYVREEHRGAALARNRGIEVANAEIVTFLDSDDEAEPSWLASITRPFDAIDVGIVCAGYTTVEYQSGDRLAETVHLPEPGGPLYANQIVNYMPGSFAVRREILVGVGGYRDQPARQQKELGRRITTHALEHGFRIVAVPEPLIRWHQHEGPRISTNPVAVYEGTLATIEHEGESIRATSRREYARLRRSAAFNAMRVGLPRDAVHHLVSAVRSDPRDWRAYVRLGEASVATLRQRSKRG